MKFKKRTVAYCFASGDIEIGPDVVPGSLPLIAGEEEAVRDLVSVRARHAYDGKTLLVPGIPEAQDQSEAFDAMCVFQEWLLDLNDGGIYSYNQAFPENAGNPLTGE